MDSLLENFFGFNHSSQMVPPTEFPGNQNRVGKQSSKQQLEEMGVQVIVPSPAEKGQVDWSSLAGYEGVKTQVEESVILGLKHPSLFDKIIAKTRAASSRKNINPVTNKPKVVLFEGPPGTGKSSTARIIANETNVPMVHIPLESVVSKWFGESEKHISQIYQLSRDLAENCGASSVILFIDEIDSLVSSRDIGTPHEASKRILSVMLRQIDGFNTENDSGIQATLICATNRKKDLDPAFLSRVDASIHFGLPSEDSRAKILKLYAKHLSQDDIHSLAVITEGLSGRNLKDLCQSAERQWAATLIRGLPDDSAADDIDVSAPPAFVYEESARRKFNEQLQS
jgi:SpoVK/Ycf46/Vps4 family AAA+-type ATPase